MKGESNSISQIVILGGGSAGWMTAATLANAVQKGCKITLVESDAIGTVGVGEATIPPIKQFNLMLGIDEKSFLTHTKGTFKLGIQFVDWGKKQHAYFHPFGPHGRQFDLVSLHQYWLKEAQNGYSHSLDEHCMAWALAKKNKFNFPLADPRNVLSTFDYAYHFDAGLYAEFLKKLAVSKGVEAIEGKVTEVETHEHNGHVASLKLVDGKIISGDFFIDCSGFKGLLINETLGVAFRDWGHWLPCDSAIAVQSKPAAAPSPYTISTAKEAGWQWQIPLQHRMGNGYVYASRFTDEKTATRTVLDSVGDNACSQPRHIVFQTGRREQFWHKNVLAIGLAAGFLEPLESTSLHLIQSSVTRLLGLFPDKNFDVRLINEFNRITGEEYERIRDFLVLHYYLNQREEDFWRHCQKIELPDSLQYRMEQFKCNGRIAQDGTDLFGPASWLSVHIGQFNRPERLDPMLQFRTVKSADWLNKLRESMALTATDQPNHSDVLRRISGTQHA